MLAAALLVALLATVALLIRVTQLKRVAEKSWNDLYETAMYAHAGMYVPAYAAVTIGGDSVQVGEVPAGERQVLYFFTTSCPYCRASLPAWTAIGSEAASRPDVQVLGIAVDSSSALDEYVGEHALTYPVIRMASARYARLFRAGGVPLTMVVEPGGRVAYARRGEFSSPMLSDSLRSVLAREFPVEDADTGTTATSVSGS